MFWARGHRRPDEGAVATTAPITVISDPVLQFRAVDAITDLAEELTADRPLTRPG
jgi:hypothetical protein